MEILLVDPTVPALIREEARLALLEERVCAARAAVDLAKAVLEALPSNTPAFTKHDKNMS